jgi:protein-tyrosine phosphatase
VTAPITDMARTVELDGCFNFRDLGGYETDDGRRVRWRHLFRADGLHRLTDSDHARLADLGLVTVVDLRTHDEVAERGMFQSPGDDVVRHHLSMLDVLPPREELPTWIDADVVAWRYLEMLGDGEETIAEVFALLTDPSTYPAVFHCAAGRDRTGIVAALVLGVLGVPDNLIVSDYALSGDAMARMMAWLRAEHPDRAAELASSAPAMLTVAAETMIGFLAGFRAEYRSFDHYADVIGVGSAPGFMRAALLDA